MGYEDFDEEMSVNKEEMYSLIPTVDEIDDYYLLEKYGITYEEWCRPTAETIIKVRKKLGIEQEDEELGARHR